MLVQEDLNRIDDGTESKCRSSVGSATYSRRRGGKWLSSERIRRAKWKPPAARRTAIRASCWRVRGRLAKQSMRASNSFTILVLKEYPLDLCLLSSMPNRVEILVDEFRGARIPVLPRRARCLVEPGRALSCSLHCTLLCGVLAMPSAQCTFFN